MFQKDLYKGQVALVTGGRSGIGYAIAKMMLQLGAKVMIASRKEGPLQKAAEELSEFGTVAAQVCDIRKTEEIQAMAQAIKEQFGRLDILINNAGGQFPALTEMINDKGWHAVINNNLHGTFFMTREMFLHFFKAQKSGTIVNITANNYRGFPGMAHTGAARAGVENLTKTLAVEWSEYNVRINCIAPGTIESSGLEQYPPQVKQFFDLAREAVPLGRFGTVDDIANAVCFIASPMASYITGTTLYVDGAQHLNSDVMGLPKVMKKMFNL